MKRHLLYGMEKVRTGVVLAGAACLILFSCVKEVDWELRYQEQDLLVVEGKITSDAMRHEVKLTRPFYEMNATAEVVRGARMEIFDGEVLHNLHEDLERPGIYLTDSLFSADLNQYYQLRILHEEKRISAVTWSWTGVMSRATNPCPTPPPMR